MIARLAMGAVSEISVPASVSVNPASVSVNPASVNPASVNPANQAAQNLIGRPYLSWSAVSTFMQCPLKFKFRYLERLPEETLSSSLLFGSGIHQALEEFFRAELAGGPKPTLEKLVYIYRSTWLPADPEAVSLGGSDTRESLDRLAVKVLRAFLASDSAGLLGHVLGVEEEISGLLVEGVPDLLGRVDLVTEEKDSLTITDFKTSRGKWSADTVEEASSQLLLYSSLAGAFSPKKTIRLRFVVLTKTANPTVEQHFAEINPQKLARVKKIFERVWGAIQTGVFYPAPSVMNCSGCGFKQACAAWTGG